MKRFCPAFFRELEPPEDIQDTATIATAAWRPKAQARCPAQWAAWAEASASFADAARLSPHPQARHLLADSEKRLQSDFEEEIGRELSERETGLCKSVFRATKALRTACKGAGC